MAGRGGAFIRMNVTAIGNGATGSAPCPPPSAPATIGHSSGPSPPTTMVHEPAMVPHVKTK